MRNLTFAAGLATGYVLGTRAGRERYEQIAKNAREFAGHPKVVQAQSKAKDLFETASGTVASKVTAGMPDTQRVLADGSPRP